MFRNVRARIVAAMAAVVLFIGCVGFGYFVIAVSGKSITILGSIEDTDAIWSRADEFCELEDDSDYFFDSFIVQNLTGADQVIDITAEWLDGDGYLHVIQFPANPADLSRCLRGNDDYGETEFSRIVNVPIAKDTLLVIIASTYSSDDAIGDYEIVVATQ